MSKSFTRACLTGVICFVVGFLCSPVVIGVWKANFVTPLHRQREREAYSFFYREMFELFEGTYNPQSRFVSEDALNDYKKHADRLGSVCQVHLGQDSAGNFVGRAFFPSGDVFDVEVFRSHEHLELTRFFPRDWSQLWAETLRFYGVSDTKQSRVGN